MSLCFRLIRLARLCMSSSLYGPSKEGDSRGLALLQEDAGQRQLQSGLQHLDGQRLQLQHQVQLGGRGAGVLFHVHTGGGQHLPLALLLLRGGRQSRHSRDSQNVFISIKVLKCENTKKVIKGLSRFVHTLQ
ncbi:hypothetical protein COCON_G00043270 [Conger conger]|uniref:Uncharacterized protein n=1 Tax=Conger conger TaxID=82655 RepID=A0A9Q1DU03_CONCO|nr:hypothetical protein COCON_G00043270 [Conger conger]